jgi:uncharacterized membrane protein
VAVVDGLGVRTVVVLSQDGTCSPEPKQQLQYVPACSVHATVAAPVFLACARIPARDVIACVDVCLCVQLGAVPQ